MANDLSQSQIASLIADALAARDAAYAPFSGFRVGAALLASDGRTFRGVNVENSSYGLTICAERTAAVCAVAAGVRQFAGIAIASPGGAAPCGACRQFLYEFGDLPVWLVHAETGTLRVATRLEELLPGGFRLGDLQRE